MLTMILAERRFRKQTVASASNADVEAEGGGWRCSDDKSLKQKRIKRDKGDRAALGERASAHPFQDFMAWHRRDRWDR